MKERGFELISQRLVGKRHGCNEFIFNKIVKELN
jgi:hypothetical protein